MDLTVAIPSRGRNQQLMRLLDRLEAQTLASHRFEVLVGIDGSDAPSPHPRASFLALPHRGPASTRNTLIDHAQSRLLLFLNDDVLPEPDLLETHLRAHENLGSSDLVLGSAPWAIDADDTLFDRLIRETSLIFFYDAMNEVERDRDWGFRHAWTLNLSLETELARRCRFDERLTRAMFEDLEWAYRLTQSHGSRVLYRPSARVTHEHRYTPKAYLEREQALGAQALTLAELNPDCANAIFRREIRDPGFVRECRHLCEQESKAMASLQREFEQLSRTPADTALDVQEIYQRFVALKRYRWRQGLVEEATCEGLASMPAA